MARRHAVAKNVKQNYLPLQASEYSITLAPQASMACRPSGAHIGVDRRMRAGVHNFSGGRRESQPRVEPMPVCFPDSGLLLRSEAEGFGSAGIIRVSRTAVYGADPTSERPSDATGE